MKKLFTYERTCAVRSKSENDMPEAKIAEGRYTTLSERHAHIEDSKQVGHWDGNTVIGANHKHAIVTVVEHKSGY